MDELQISNRGRRMSIQRKRHLSVSSSQLSLFQSKENRVHQTLKRKEDSKDFTSNFDERRHQSHKKRDFSADFKTSLFDQSYGNSNACINLSNLSYLGDKYDVEALTKGNANAVIFIKGRKYEFNHKDQIFSTETLEESKVK